MDSLLDSAPCGFLSFSDDGLILMINTTLLDTLGYTRQELQGRHIESILAIPGRIFYQTHFFPLLKLQGKADELYLLMKASGGETVPALANAARRERDGLIVNDCVLVPMRQRSRYEDEILQAKRAAEEANRLKDEFLATVSHELRSPLTAILGWVRILRTRPSTPERVTRAIDVIERNAQAQAQLIDDLLDVSRIITGQMRLHVQPLDLVDVVGSAIESVRPAAEARGVEILTAVEPDPGPIAGDAARLQQVLWNLLSNAIKFTPTGGEVAIRLARVDSHLELKISDTGIGIPPQFLPYIFERFRQVDQGTQRQHGGLGLGLAIVRHLVELHGGEVSVHSEGENQGATFTVLLPLITLRQVAGT